MDAVETVLPVKRKGLKKSERREQILLELKLRPHFRISEMAERFGVSTETVRRDVEKLSSDGLIDRAHGGASAPAQGQYPGFNERSGERQKERERIGQRAAELVQPGETLMIDSGSTTLQLARALAFAGTPCTVITNSLPVAMALGQSDSAEVIICPGEYLRSESAVVGTEAVAFLNRHSVDRCLIGASGLSDDGPSEAVLGFAAIKRAMLQRSRQTHLLIDREKFGRHGLVQVGGLGAIASVIVDRAPKDGLETALDAAGVSVIVAPQKT